MIHTLKPAQTDVFLSSCVSCVSFGYKYAAWVAVEAWVQFSESNEMSLSRIIAIKCHVRRAGGGLKCVRGLNIAQAQIVSPASCLC